VNHRTAKRLHLQRACNVQALLRGGWPLPAVTRLDRASGLHLVDFDATPQPACTFPRSKMMLVSPASADCSALATHLHANRGERPATP